MKLQITLYLVLVMFALQSKSERSEAENKVDDHNIDSHLAMELTDNLEAIQNGLNKDIEQFLEKVKKYYFDHGEEILGPIDSALTKLNQKLTAEQKRLINEFFAYIELIKNQLRNFITKNNAPYDALPVKVKENLQQIGRDIEKILKTFKETVDENLQKKQNSLDK